MAGPVSPGWDVAFAAFSWVPLHARHVVAGEGFTGFEDRPRRLQLFLAEYGWANSTPALLEAVTARIQAHVASLRDLAGRDPLFARIVARGEADDLETALAELEHFAWSPPRHERKLSEAGLSHTHAACRIHERARQWEPRDG